MRFRTGLWVSIILATAISCDPKTNRRLADTKEGLSGTPQDENPSLNSPDGESGSSAPRIPISWDFEGGFEAPPWNGAELALQNLESVRIEAFRDLYRPSDEQVYNAFSKLTRAPAATRFANGVVAQWLRSSGYPDKLWYQNSTTQVDVVRKRSNSDCTNYGFLMAASELGKHIYNEKRSLKGLVTADYVMVNPCTARSLGLDVDKLGFGNPQDSQSFVAVTLQSHVRPGETYPHAGILSDFAFLLRYPAQGANLNRSRASFVLRDLLGVDLTEAAANAELAEGVFDNPVMDNPQCVSCHTVMDPVAQLFMGFDGTVNETAPRFRTDMFPAGLFGKSYGALEAEQSLQGIHWLAQEISKSEPFAKQMMVYFWTELFGLSRQRFSGQAELDIFDAFFNDMLARFKETDLRLDRLIDLTLSDDRLRTLRPAMVENELSSQVFRPVSAGTFFGRLKRMIEGGGPDGKSSQLFAETLRKLQNDYDEGLGEPDLASLERRLPEIDLIYSASFARVSSEFACFLAAHEVAKSQSSRLVFKLSDEASPASKKRNWSTWYEDLSHLHVRLTGELPRPEEVLRYWKLYHGIQAGQLETASKISAGCQTFVTGALKQPQSWLSPENVAGISRLSGLLFFMMTDPRVIQF